MSWEGKVYKRVIRQVSSARTKAGMDVTHGILVDEHLRYASKQAGEQFLDRDGKGDRGLLRHPLPGLERRTRPQRMQPVEDLPMGHHHPFGTTGGTGGVHHVGHLRRMQGMRQWRMRLTSDGGIVQAQQRYLDQLPVDVLAAEQQPWLRVVEDLLNVGGGVMRVQRHVAATGLEHAEQGNEEIGRAVEPQGDALPRAQAAFDQAMRQAVGVCHARYPRR